MAKKILILVLLFSLIGLLSPNVWAGELVNLERIREEPVNIFKYAEVTINTGAVIFANFLKTTNPVGLCREGHGVGGATITLVEGFLHPQVNLVAGATLKNKEPSRGLYGLELKLKFKGDLGATLSRFRPGIYWSNDEWWFGVSLNLRKFSI